MDPKRSTFDESSVNNESHVEQAAPFPNENEPFLAEAEPFDNENERFVAEVEPLSNETGSFWAEAELLDNENESFLAEAHCSRTIKEHSIVWEEVTMLRHGWDNHANLCTKDARTLAPQSQSELHALQLAIRPTLDDCTWLTKREPTVSNPWLSYNDQMDHFQKEIDKYTKKQGREEKTLLLRLDRWDGGIDIDKISKLIEQRVPTKVAFNRLNTIEPRPRPRRGATKPAWCRNHEVPKLAAYMQSQLVLPPLIKPTSARTDPCIDNFQEALCNELVANDTEPFKRWLNTKGLTFYEGERWGTETPPSWNFWCRYFAPSAFIVKARGYRSDPMLRKAPGPSVEMKQRPVLSLEKAERARRAWQLPKGGHRVSKEGRVFLHAMRDDNPMMTDRVRDVKHYYVGIKGREETDDIHADFFDMKGADSGEPAEANVSKKRATKTTSSSGHTKPVKRVLLADYRPTTKAATRDEVRFIAPGLTLI